MKKLNSEYTDNKIKNSFIELLLEKEYKDITISDITNRSHINRTTFYLFYSSKDELLKEICYHYLDWYLDSFIECFNCLDINSMNLLKDTFNTMKKESRGIMALFKVNEADFSSYLIMQKGVEDVLFNYFKKSDYDLTKVSLFCKYYAANALATVDWWIHNNEQYDVDYIVDIIYTCVNLGMAKMLD